MPSHLIEFYSGWERHNQLLVTALAPLRDEELAWAPARDLWPVRRLANHIVAARAWWFAGWMGEDREVLTALIDYDDQPDADEREAKHICDALNVSWASLAKSLGRWTDLDLQQSFQRPSPNEKASGPRAPASTSSGTSPNTTFTTAARSPSSSGCMATRAWACERGVDFVNPVRLGCLRTIRRQCLGVSS